MDRTMSALDRDAAREVLLEAPGCYWGGIEPANDVETTLDALQACVRLAPPQAIDRDALVRQVGNEIGSLVSAAAGIDAILALLRPVSGVVLTPVEAAQCADALRVQIGEYGYEHSENKVRDALAKKLEAAS